MSKPTEAARVQFTADRQRDAHQAALKGEGWKALSQKWGVTNACALQWCRDNVPASICKIIGENGKRARQPFVGHKTDYAGKPKLIDARMLQPVRPNQACRKVSYRDGDAYECGEPTEGKTYCPACAQKRVEQVYAAAENGFGWKDLAQRWNVTNACALQWSQRHVPEAICKTVGQNGLRSREGKGVRKYLHNKPRLVEAWSNKPKGPNQFCKKISYRDGDAYECAAPTEGKTYCPACAQKLLTLTDRAPLPDQPAPKPFHWATDQILPRKRA